MRIKTIRGQRRLNGGNPRTGSHALPRDTADVSTVNGGTHLNYYPSSAAFAVAKEWSAGCDVEWDVDDGLPAIARLTPASGRGYNLRQPANRHHRPHFVLPTADVGIPANVVFLKQVEEVTITAEVITIKLPFGFTAPETNG